MLQQLEGAGLLIRENNGRHYGTGSRLRRLAENLLLNDSHHGARHAVLRDLVEELGESCNLTALSGSEIVYLDRVETAEPLRFYLHPGSRVPAHCSASGKMFLVADDARQRRRLLERRAAAAVYAQHGHRRRPARGGAEAGSPRRICDRRRGVPARPRLRRRARAVDLGDFQPVRRRAGAGDAADARRGALARCCRALRRAPPTPSARSRPKVAASESMRATGARGPYRSVARRERLRHRRRRCRCRRSPSRTSTSRDRPGLPFRPRVTLALLAGFARNRRVLVQGLHGTGKSTHIEQVAARLNWPCVRVNLDGQISRLDLVGRDAVSLRRASRSPSSRKASCRGRCSDRWRWSLDEYDAGRPDVMFVIQRILEQEGSFTLLDQNRVIAPHPVVPALRNRRTPSGSATSTASTTGPAAQPRPDRPLEHRRHARLPSAAEEIAIVAGAGARPGRRWPRDSRRWSRWLT